MELNVTQLMIHKLGYILRIMKTVLCIMIISSFAWCVYNFYSIHGNLQVGIGLSSNNTTLQLILGDIQSITNIAFAFYAFYIPILLPGG